MYENGPLTLRLAYNRRSKYPEGSLAERDNFFTLQGRGRPLARLDWSSNYAFNDHLTLFFDWTNILKKPFKSDIWRVNYPGGTASNPKIFPLVVRYEKSVLTGGSVSASGALDRRPNRSLMRLRRHRRRRLQQ